MKMQVRNAQARVAILLGTTALLTALASQTAAAAPSVASRGHFVQALIRPSRGATLWDQTGHDSGIGIVSQNFESTFDAYDCQSADDFVVPPGTKWRVSEVDVIGTYFNGSGAAESENVVFYKDRHGKPDGIVAQYNAIVGGDHWGTFTFDLGTGVRLKPGHYWLSIQTNQIFNKDGEWGWEASADVVDTRSVWRDPGGAFVPGCSDWTTQTDCFDYGQGDQMFALKGRAH
jgi:hypothetical protein